MTSFPLRVTRLGFRILGNLAPPVAGRLAFRLFCTTPGRTPKSTKAWKVHSEGLTLLARADRRLLPLENGAAMAWRLKGTRPDSKRFVIVHGWASGATYMAKLGAALARTGDEVILIDFPGHGAAPGRRLDMLLATRAIAAAEACFGPIDGLIGHSFGGAAAVLAANGAMPGVPKVSPKRLVLMAAPSDMGFVFGGFAETVGLPARARAAFSRRSRAVTGRDASDFDAGRLLAALDRPILVLHAEDDKEVPAEHARRYGAAGPHVALSWANGQGHRRIVSDAATIARIAAFLAED